MVRKYIRSQVENCGSPGAFEMAEYHKARFHNGTEASRTQERFDTSCMQGLMLAERPADPVPKPFRPSCATEKLEPLGLCPTKKIFAINADEKPLTATMNHKQWLKQFEDEQRQGRELEQQAAFEEQAKKQVCMSKDDYSCVHAP
jgi:hypothetical protein